MSFVPLLNRCCYKCSQPLAIVSAPGYGKTSIIEKWCADNNLPLVKLLASSMDETDIGGIIVAKDDSATQLTPNWSKVLQNRGVLFLDEINTARKEVTDTLLTMVQSRQFPNGEKIGEGVLIIAAMNPAEMCDNYDLSPAMISRFMWVRQTMSVSQFLAWSTGQELHTFDNAPAPVKYVTYKEWHKRFQSDRNFEADKKALMQEAISRGFNFVDDESVNEGGLVANPRTVQNLMYWTANAFEMQKWAPAFIDENNASILASVDVSSLDNVSNTIFGDKTGKRTEVSEEESEYIKQQSGILNRINGEVNKGNN